jgi:cell division protease FtsH
MVTEYGMSSLGPMQFEHRTESVFLGRDYNQSKNFSDQVALQIDQEVKKIIDECYKESKDIVRKNKKLIDILANTLIEKETLTKEEIEDIVEANSDYKFNHESFSDKDESIKEVQVKKEESKSKKEEEKKTEEK